MSPWTILERIASIIPRNNAITKTTKTTTAVPLIASLRVGHVTFFTSALTSPRNSIAFENIILKQVNTGQEGFEPPTLGFGIRCSTVRATDLIRNPHHFQRRDGTTPPNHLSIQQNPHSQPPSFLYLVSLWGVCFLQNLQYFINSSLCVVVILFLVPE